jgi:hypothetical protein
MLVRRWFDVLLVVVLLVTLALTVRDALATAGIVSKSQAVYGWRERSQQISYPDKEIGK